LEYCVVDVSGEYVLVVTDAQLARLLGCHCIQGWECRAQWRDGERVVQGLCNFYSLFVCHHNLLQVWNAYNELIEMTLQRSGGLHVVGWLAGSASWLKQMRLPAAHDAVYQADAAV